MGPRILERRRGVSRLTIPRHFLRASPWRTAEIIARATAIWLVPAFLAFTLLRATLPVRSPWGLLAVPLFLLAGQGLQLFGIIGHDGFHGNLHQGRVKRLLIGLFRS